MNENYQFPSTLLPSLARKSRKPVLANKYYVKVSTRKSAQHISGLGTFITRESIGQNGCMIDKVSQDRFLQTLA